MRFQCNEPPPPTGQALRLFDTVILILLSAVDRLEDQFAMGNSIAS
jgi:hypothetical protein